MEEEARPSQKNTVSKVYRDRQALAQNLRVRTRKTCPEGEHIPTGQNEKNNFLEPCGGPVDALSTVHVIARSPVNAVVREALLSTTTLIIGQRRKNTWNKRQRNTPQSELDRH